MADREFLRSPNSPKLTPDARLFRYRRPKLGLSRLFDCLIALHGE
jgi:hypothetical protein